MRPFSVPSGQKVHATAQGSTLLPLRPLIRLARAPHRACVQVRCCASACRCRVPRDKGGIGRTGSKHKKKGNKKKKTQVRAAAEPLVTSDDDDIVEGTENEPTRANESDIDAENSTFNNSKKGTQITPGVLRGSGFSQPPHCTHAGP